MTGDVKLGRYYPSDSVLHRLDPRTKLLFFILYVVSVFFASSVATCIHTCIVLLILIALSCIPVRFFFKGLLKVMVFTVSVGLADVLFFKAPLAKTALIVLRISQIMTCSNLLALTTKPKDIADGIEKSLAFLRVLRIPVHDFAAIVSIAIRFIPVLAEEADRIKEAQKVRGADFNHLKAYTSVVVPLFESAFRKAEDLSVAMDSRLYGYGKRTRLHELRFKSQDVLSFILCAEYVAVFALWRVMCL